MARSGPKDMLWPSEPRTVLKHNLYKRYLQCWMGKICRVFDRSVVVDAFAGPGEYIDGPDGSPLVIAKTFLTHRSLPDFKHFQLICAELRPDRRDHLEQLLTPLAAPPKLQIEVRPAGGFVEQLAAIAAAAHAGNANGTPTLWILDPYNYSDLPFDVVVRCLAAPRDEVLITWFADEIYRFRNDPPKADAITRHFGGNHWKAVRSVQGDALCKKALRDQYEAGLRAAYSDLQVRSFDISSRNESARYSIVFATHNRAGLECFNPAVWAMDPTYGQKASENRLAQNSLFARDLTALRAALATRAGTSATFVELRLQANQLGFTEPQLREALDDLQADGIAVREAPVESRTQWPADSVVRFYGAT